MIPKPKQITPIGVVWDPFRSSISVKQMIDSMDRLLDSSLSYTRRPALSESLKGGRTPWDAIDKENEIRMRFDMPGMPREAVKVSIEDNILIIKAEDPREEKEDERWSSRSYGRYYTRIPLPENCKTDEIDAELKDGVLFVRVPKAKEEPKVVNVDVR